MEWWNITSEEVYGNNESQWGDESPEEWEEF